jgi:hypothetical protein
MRYLAPVLLLAGCSSTTKQSACLFTLSGDLSGTRDCQTRFCRDAMGDAIDIAGLTPFGPEVDLTVDGTFTPGRNYAAADLKTFSASLESDGGGVRYLGGSQVAGSTVTLRFNDIEPNNNTGCASGNATAHGTVQVAGLVEQLDSGTSSGQVTLDATF